MAQQIYQIRGSCTWSDLILDSNVNRPKILRWLEFIDKTKNYLHPSNQIITNHKIYHF